MALRKATPAKLWVYYVVAEFDDEAKVWVATSEDVLGLVTEAPTREALALKLGQLVPELLDANNAEVPDDVKHMRVPVVSVLAWRTIQKLLEAGCELDHLADGGGYGVWYSPNTQASFTLDWSMATRSAANKVLLFAGVPESF